LSVADSTSSDTGGSGTAADQTVSRLRRQRLVLGIALVTAVLSAAGVGASVLVKSPQEAALEAEGPSPSVLTAPVEQKVLRQTVVIRGQVGAGRTIEVTPTPIGENTRAVVTAIRLRPGSDVKAGSVIVEISGRPLVALSGLVPAYRDLRPGAQGDDVAQLQSALTTLGHPSADERGYFGAGTKRAVKDFYETLGFSAATTGKEDERALQAARQAVRTAERALEDAEEALIQARQSGQAAVPTKSDFVRAAEQTVRRMKEDLDASRATLRDLEETTGPMLPLSEVVFLPSFPSRVEKLSADVGAEVKTPLLTLSSGALLVNANLTPAIRSLLRDGMPAEIFSESLGITAAGKLGTIGDLVPDASGTASHRTSVIPDKSLDPRLAGQDVRLTIEAARTGGEVLAVPISAIFGRANGSAAVLKRGLDGREERIEVTAGTSADGFVEVTPVSGHLQAGDRVVVSAAHARDAPE
jgi:hypothetical protein